MCWTQTEERVTNPWLSNSTEPLAARSLCWWHCQKASQNTHGKQPKTSSAWRVGCRRKTIHWVWASRRQTGSSKMMTRIQFARNHAKTTGEAKCRGRIPSLGELMRELILWRQWKREDDWHIYRTLIDLFHSVWASNGYHGLLLA